ncbi:abortive infection system antitoxin AbiGi family protein [Staphylococcus saprophyticus]
MKQKEHLFNIISEMGMYPRFNEEKFEFLDVKYGDENLNQLYIPMLCFCDIPLKNLTNHNLTYGNYAIALTKSWGEKNKISPIHYLYKNSDVYEQLRELFNLANIENNEVLYNYLFNRLFFTKPKEGIENNEVIDKENGMTKTEPKFVLYTDEQEHRYVPNHANINTDIAQFYINKDLPLDELSNSLAVHNKYKLSFEVSDVKHIVLPSRGEKIELINNIINSQNIKNIEDKYELISKLITLQEIEEDF